MTSLLVATPADLSASWTNANLCKPFFSLLHSFLLFWLQLVPLAFFFFLNQFQILVSVLFMLLFFKTFFITYYDHKHKGFCSHKLSSSTSMMDAWIFLRSEYIIHILCMNFIQECFTGNFYKVSILKIMPLEALISQQPGFGWLNLSSCLIIRPCMTSCCKKKHVTEMFVDVFWDFFCFCFWFIKQTAVCKSKSCLYIFSMRSSENCFSYF